MIHVAKFHAKRIELSDRWPTCSVCGKICRVTADNGYCMVAGAVFCTKCFRDHVYIWQRNYTLQEDK